MLFNSLHFLVFFPFVVILYFLVPKKFQMPWLLLASCYFYAAWKLEYLWLLIAATSIDYLAARFIQSAASRSSKISWLICSLTTNLGILFFFKYFHLFENTTTSIAASFGTTLKFPAFEFLLPIGISFYTFQAMSYVIDVFKGLRRAEEKYLTYMLYITFFPQLVAGPIERSTHLLDQFHTNKKFDFARIVSGLELMLFGFFKKVVLADNLSSLVQPVFDAPENASGWAILMATYSFAFQIYFDFSGYTDIARGAARVLGFDIMENFRNPYASRSITEFWQRWHISLSTWFRDYLYIPLGGNRGTALMWCRNIFIVFILSGLWHGAAWTFAAWGLLHAAYIILDKFFWPLFSSLRNVVPQKIATFTQIVITFNLVAVSWILFRSPDFHTATTLYKRILSNTWTISITDKSLTTMYAAIIGALILFGLAYLLKFICSNVLKLKTQNNDTVELALRWCRSYAIIVMIILFGVLGHTPFIYFQF